MNTTNKIVQSNPFLKLIRWINFLGLSLIILFWLPLSIVRVFDLDIEYQHVAGNFKLLGFYIFIAFSLWIYILFVILETKNRKKNKMKFDDYISANWLISCGYFFPIILFITLLI